MTLDDVRRHRDEIVAMGRRFGIRNVRVFGSVARGDATADSDLDLLIDVESGHGYFDMAGFALAVEDILGVYTQVATEGGLKLRIRDGCSPRLCRSERTIRRDEEWPRQVRTIVDRMTTDT